MVARNGIFPWGSQNTFAFFRNFVDEDGRSESPEQRQRVKLSPQVYTPPTRLQNPVTHDDNLPGWGARQTNREIVGPRIETLPITVNLSQAQRHARGQRHIPGGRVATGRWENLGQAPADGTAIGFDYWERVLINPDFVDLGNVVSDTQINVTIRNTFRRDGKTITDIDNNAGAGITVTGATPPANIAPLFDKLYVVTISTSGPPNIDGTIDWVVTTGTLQLTLTGTRIIIFPYPPQSEVTEELQWLTDIIKSANGTEQRHSLRVNPRQVIDYDFFSLTQSDVNNIRNLMIDWTTRVFGVPIWWNEVSLTADVTALDTVVNVRVGSIDTADFRVGGLAMIFQENEDGTRVIDSLQIASVVGSLGSPESTQNKITFVTPIQNNYDGDRATVVPVYAGILADGITVDNHRLGDTAVHRAKFRVLDNLSSIRGVEPGDYPELADFDGNPTLIIDDKILMSGAVFKEKFIQKGQLIDFNTGGFFQLTQELKARRTTPFKWIAEDEDFHWQLRALFYHLRGKWKSVWLPTWRKDFTVNTNIGAGANTIDVDNEGFARYVSGAKPWAGLRLLQTNGTISYHRITLATEIDSTTDRLTVDPVVPNAVTVAEVERLDMMILSRLTDDRIRFIHHWMDAESDETDTEIDVQFIGDLRV